MSHLYVKSGLRSGFKLSTLALSIGLSLMSSHGFALEALDDQGLAESTGEGIALLPTDTFMVFRGAGANEPTSTILSDRTADTGYIHYLPVGPLSTTAQDTNKDGSVTSADQSVGKADIYLYGLAISKSDNNTKTRLASGTTASIANAAISSWGTAANPWIFKVATANQVPNFNTSLTCTGESDTSCQVTYLTLESPLNEYAYKYNTTTSTLDFVGSPDPVGADAYKLKLGFWADAFALDQSKAPNSTALYQLGATPGSSDATRANRLRLQAIWNNFSLNGSNIKVFQTLGGVGGAGDTGINKGMSPFYNNTLGVAGVLRFNSGDASNLKAQIGTVTSTPSGTAIGTPSGWSTIWSGQDSTIANATAATGNCGNSGTGAFSGATTAAGCNYIVQKRTRTDTKAVTGTWTAPTNLNSVLRFSTQEKSDTANLATPAVSGGTAPSFADNDGLFMYNPNINLVLGSLYQPLILGSDGKNFSLELTRIPNKPEIYTKIYTNYDDSNPMTNGGYYGSTCNYYQCGNNVTLNGVTYQGSTATHSSISVGTTVYNATKNLLTAYSGNDAVGISFGGLTSGTYTSTSSNTLAELRYAQRQLTTSDWIQRNKCNGTGLFGVCNSQVSTTGYLTQWQYNNGTGYVNSANGWTNTPGDAGSCTGIGNGSGCDKTSSTTPRYGTAPNRTWSDTVLNGAAWQTGANANVNMLATGVGGVSGYTFPATTNTATAPTMVSPLGNLGSGVIDGVLIQHLKITTNGL